MANQANDFDVRHDEDQVAKLQEISDLLLAAGYFRARLKGLSYFDKVVGGLTWCLEMCSVDVDVDFLFRENLNIGEKIGITEKIVDVLNYMKCPYPLEPHQIQGLDAVQIFPVLQWLVKRAMENREARKEHLHLLAILNYEKSFPSLKTSDGLQQMVQENNAEIQPQRKYKCSSSYSPAAVEHQVRATLMEYGYFSKSSAAYGTEEETEKDEDFKPEEQNVEKIPEGRAISRCVTNILHQQAAEISKAIEDYDLRQAERLGDASGTAALENEKSRLDSQLNGLVTTKNTLIDEKNQLLEELDRLRAAREVINQRKIEIESAENVENQKIVEELRSLVASNEEIKAKIRDFKEECKIQMNQLQQRSAEAETNVTKEDESSLQETYEDLCDKVKYVQKILAQRSAEMSKLMREVDAIPGRVELNQYQRRFTELGGQIEAKQSEYKGYYLMYNSLEDRKLYLTKELSLLTSIHDHFQQAMANSKSKLEFVQQMDGIIASVRQNKAKVEDQLNQQRRRRENNRDILCELFAEEKHYKETLKAFAVERQKYEQLVSQLNA